MEVALSRNLSRDARVMYGSKAEGHIKLDQKLVRKNSNKYLESHNSNHQDGAKKSFSPLDSIADSIQFLSTEWADILKQPQWAANISAGITVAAVALPLNIALAIAAGMPASAGLIAGAIGGGFAAIFGGSRFQATGPAAALNIMVLAVVQQFGAAGAAAVAIIIGLIQLALSLLSAGSLIRFVPESILIGFTSGVGIKLLDTQLPKLFGIEWTVYDMLVGILNPIWLHEVAWPNVVCGLLVVFLILSFKSMPRVPAALIGIAIATQLAVFLNWPIHRVGEIPPINLDLIIPSFNSQQWVSLLQLAIPIGLLSAAESLLSAQAVDRISGDRHHSNLEILGQGIGNIASGLVGGMPISGVVVRSTVSVQSGAKSRLASFFHAAVLLLSALFLGKFLAVIPIAALAGLLCIIGFRLVEVSEFLHFLKENKTEALAFIAAAVGTITNHIVLGLSIGLIVVWLPKLFSNNKQISTSPKKIDAEESKHEANVNSSASPVYKLLDRGEQWIQHLKAQAHIPNTAYVHPNASVIGRVVLGRMVHIAAETSIRADEGTPFYIGDETNVQDGVVIHALKKKWVRVNDQQWAVYVGRNVSLAHQALVHGPCFIGDGTFVGFKAVVHDSIVGKGCFIGIGAVVVGVEIADEKYVPHGAIIDTPEKARQLAKVNDSHHHFNEDVVEVNKGLVEAYKELSEDITI
jgi:SulP family sulfate permease